MHQTISTQRAPEALGPYSQGVRAGGMLFCSGQIGLDPGTAALVPGGIAEQTGRALSNLEEVLREAGFSLKDVVKTTVFLVDLSEFAIMNDVYGRFFGEWRPARSTVQIAALPKDAAVEIEALALKV